MPKHVYDLHLKGYVGSADFDSNAVHNILQCNPDKEVNVLIDSTGGSLATGLTISSAFRNHGNVSVHYTGMNASAATIASMGAKHVSIDRDALYLVHKCMQAVFEWGAMNADDIAAMMEQYGKLKVELDKIDLHIAAMYASRCKKPVEDLLKLMESGAWMTPQEALEWGFVDEITDYEEDAPAVLNDTQAIAMSKAGIPLPNIPILSEKSESIFRRIEGLITKLINKTSNTTAAMKKKVLTLLCACLSIEAISISKEGATLSEEQLDKIEDLFKEKENALKEKDEKIASLEKQIEELKKEPAQKSQQVIESKQDVTTTSDPVANYIKAVNAAREYFKNR